MVKAIRIHQPGGIEQMRWEDITVDAPGRGQALIRHSAIGVNYIDTYHRSGAYPVAHLPCILGMEAAGVVEAVGPEVGEIRVGDRVAYASPPLGAYTELRLMPADRLVVLPHDIDDDQAAAMMLKGMTAQYLLRRTYRVQPGDLILVHAAAGGVGLLLCQWAKHLGATVIGTVGSDDKAALARAHGCDHAIVYSHEDFVARVKDITAGRGVAVVYDAVGRDTFARSLDCLRPLGLMALFGQASGAVPPVDLQVLSAKGSLFVTRPTLMTYTAQREDLVASAAELFEVVRSGSVKIEVRQRYALADAAQAHADLEGRKTTGSTVLQP